MPKITSIQKYSIHDGDGIRTTVFFKGCPLKCVWCHNPETQEYGAQVMHDKDRCAGCQSCVVACPHGAISCKDGKAVTDPKICEKCGVCTDHCVANLREISGMEYDVKSIVDEVMKDEMFYEESGGGVTLSGGEVMTMNMDFIEDLVKKLYKKGISITIDTCGYAKYENYQRILPYIDTFLYDVKAMDSDIHCEYTGVDNKLILENLKKLSADGARIYIRIPTIKEVNGTEEHMNKVIDFLQENHISVAQVNLLPYHNIGAGKYDKMGGTYQGYHLSAPTNEEMEHFVEVFQNRGYQNTKIGG
ncbi:MAG: trans-4-hydroxy-L-proline dehydratase activase [Eubacteriales bacterium]